jgi:uncharacterized membrane protein YccF (DUF307 family)
MENMNPQVEVIAIVYVFFVTAIVVIFGSIITYILIIDRPFVKKTYNLVKLLLVLYEKEREKNEKTDEGGFGT